MDVMTFNGSYSFDYSTQRALPYDLRFEDLKPEELLFIYQADGQEEEHYSVYGFNLVLKRDFQPFIFRVYLPTALLVVTSWISFTVR